MPTSKKLDLARVSDLDLDSLSEITEYLSDKDLSHLLLGSSKLTLALSLGLNKRSILYYEVKPIFEILTAYPAKNLIHQRNVLTIAKRLSVKEHIHSLMLISSSLLEEKSTIPEEIFEFWRGIPSWMENDSQYLQIFFPLFNQQQRTLALSELLMLFAHTRSADHNLLYLKAIFSLMPYVNKEEMEQIEKVFLTFVNRNLKKMGGAYRLFLY